MLPVINLVNQFYIKPVLSIIINHVSNIPNNIYSNYIKCGS